MVVVEAFAHFLSFLVSRDKPHIPFPKEVKFSDLRSSPICHLGVDDAETSEMPQEVGRLCGHEVLALKVILKMRLRKARMIANS